MQLKQHDRDYLAVLEEQDGTATTSDIRKKTDMNGRQVNYRHEKLSKNNVVRIELDNSLTPDGAAGMQVSHLTEKGEELISEGEAVEGETEKPVEDQLEEIRERISEVEDTMEGAFPWLNEFAARVRRLEDAFEAVTGQELDELGTVDEYQNEGGSDNE